jgi:hypothetical protein
MPLATAAVAAAIGLFSCGLVCSAASDGELAILGALLAVGGALTAGLAICHVLARGNAALLLRLAYGVLLMALIVGAVCACVTTVRRTDRPGQPVSSERTVGTAPRR